MIHLLLSLFLMVLFEELGLCIRYSKVTITDKKSHEYSFRFVETSSEGILKLETNDHWLKVERRLVAKLTLPFFARPAFL